MMKNDETWYVLTEVFTLEESNLIRGMLETAGIPVEVKQESAGELFGLTVGPLSKIQIMIPVQYKEEAEELIALS